MTAGAKGLTGLMPGIFEMLHTYALDRAARYFPDRPALPSGGRRVTFSELHDRVAGIAAALRQKGFARGDRLGLLLSVHEAAVFGIPDPQWGEIVMGCIVRKPGQTVTPDELIALCRRSLANYKIPRRIEFSDVELPKSGTGKILKRALRERFWASPDRAVA